MKKFLLYNAYVIIFLMLIISLSNCNVNKKDEKNRIKQIYCNHINKKSSNSNFDSANIEIKHYLGKYGDAYCAVIKGDKPEIAIPLTIYTIKFEDEEFEFKYLPEIISVYYNNEYHYLNEACQDGILTVKDIKKLEKYCNVLFYFNIWGKIGY